MTINISTLFADIIDTPEQRQQKLLQQGMAQGQLLASGLTGRSRALAPLAQMAGQLGVQRNEDLRRAVQPMFGIDPRTTGEKLQEQIGEMDASTPEGLLKAAQSLQSVDPIRAAALRQAASQMRMDMEDREMAQTTEQMRQAQLGVQTSSAIQNMRLAETQEDRAAIAAGQDERMSVLTEAARGLEISQRARQFIDDATRRENTGTFADSIDALGTEYSTYAEGIRTLLLDPSAVMQDIARAEAAKFRATNALSYQGLSKIESDRLFKLAKLRPNLAEKLDRGFFGGQPDVSQEQISELAARYSMMHPQSGPTEQLNYIEATILTGIGAEINAIDIEEMAQEQSDNLSFDPDAAAAAAAAGLGLDATETEQDLSIDLAFESVLQNLEATNSDTAQAVTRYLNRTKAEIGSTKTAIRNRQAANSDASELESKLSVLESRLNRYSQ
tara:strand:- start:372 stop:1703 length:1332 start_codon:yes stop_codon:yes gene_type:complete